ncbi:AAA family ATPase [Gordonia sp. ABSL49_1]|uniref:AAA family ATPase n=1 Tax=Gordonia sp. ABSL49_1 TaxID=2920941 RepID=UPI001F0D5C38|nr:AAA family ATPase [Gordonia sp. ABSL49_1]MCH5645684.1 AAA family ATPase [Gordonia sp. ABSL49_1]
MLTRLEVDGFKNLFEVKIDFGPYTCIAGPNAVGKSNLFDVIEFLSLIADYPFMEAAQQIRSAGDRVGDPRTLFFVDGSKSPPPMTLAAEMLVPKRIHDDFGEEAEATSTFLRYEVTLEYVAPSTSGPLPIGGIRLLREDLTYIKQSLAYQRLRWPMRANKFRQAVVRNERKGKGFISTGEDGTFHVHQDGGSRGQPRRSAAAPRTVLSTINTTSDPTALAARREMQQWRKLSLEPSAMRAPDSLTGPSVIGSDGSHLAAALFRMARQGEDDNIYAAVASTASALVDVREINVDFDATRDLLTLEARVGDAPLLPARALSEGTLRFIALSVIEADESFGGLICMEEPENGIHPAKIEAMVTLVRELAVDPNESPGSDNPLRQVITNTHSPRFVTYQQPGDILLASPRTVNTGSSNGTVETVAFVPLWDTWRSTAAEFAVSKGFIGEYLSEPDDAPLQLDYPGREIEGIA